MQPFRFWFQDQLHDKGWSGAQFAERTGIAVSTVNFWLSGKNKPSRRFVVKIAAALDTSEQDVWDMVLERGAPRYGDVVSRTLNLPSDLTVQEARYLHLAHQTFRRWQREMRDAGMAQYGETPT